MSIAKVHMFILVVCVSLSAQADDENRFRKFAELGIPDHRLSNDDAQEMVRNGVASENEEIVNLTVRALGTLASRLAHRELLPTDDPPPSRSFGGVQGLKEFLIDYWHLRFSESGFNTVAAMDLKALEHENLTLEEVASRVWALPSWPMIPQILCVFWPGDTDVLRLLWHQHETDLSPNQTQQTLGLLNTGRFDSLTVNEFRMTALRSAVHSQDFRASDIVRLVAKGMEISPKAEALPLLVEAGTRYADARRGVFLALAAYEDIQLASHGEALASIMELTNPQFLKGAESEAFERLESVLESGIDQ